MLASKNLEEIQTMDLRQDYINLLESCLLGEIYSDFSRFSTSRWWQRMVLEFFHKRGLELVKKENPSDKQEGRDWPELALTMAGRKRMDNLRFCVERVIKDNVPGDLIETGVWRGGACIFMRGLLKAFEVRDKWVYVADSFEGLPPSTNKFDREFAPQSNLDNKVIGVSLEDVKENFRKFNLLDDQVKFLKGWFRDTLKTAPIKSLSILRLDGDLYESTMDALRALYPKLSVGGYLIVDDYASWKTCQMAVDDYRRENNITEEIIPIDWSGVYWRRAR